MSIMYYILKGKEVVLEPNLFNWAEWMEKANTRVRYNELPDNVFVSTVFLGVSIKNDELFETMIFGGEFDRCALKYATWEEAESGHQMVLDGILNSNLNFKI